MKCVLRGFVEVLEPIQGVTQFVGDDGIEFVQRGILFRDGVVQGLELSVSPLLGVETVIDIQTKHDGEAECDHDQPDKGGLPFDEGFLQLVVGAEYLKILLFSFQVESDIQLGELAGVFYVKQFLLGLQQQDVVFKGGAVVTDGVIAIEQSPVPAYIAHTVIDIQQSRFCRPVLRRPRPVARKKDSLIFPPLHKEMYGLPIGLNTAQSHPPLVVMKLLGLHPRVLPRAPPFR
jgi:hypothetical protein